MNPYEPVTIPHYQLYVLQHRCAQLEDESIALEKASGLTEKQLTELFLRGYSLCPPGGPAISKDIEASTIKDLLNHYPLTTQHVAVLGYFCKFTAMNPGQLQDFLWRQLLLWQTGIRGSDILKRNEII